MAILFCACSTYQKSDITETQRAQPPNLVLIIADDLGYADVGFNGCKDIPTPHIDRIAKEGVLFTNGYVTWPACGPSRAGLITGRYQGRFGFSRNPLFAPNDPNMGLPLSEQTLSEALQQAGYRSAAIGKWHLGAHPSQRPLKRGFDDFFGFLTGGHRYFPEEWTLADEYEVTAQFEAYKTKLLRNDTRIEESEYLTDALSREAAHYIKEYKDNPFFIYLSYNAPHAPLQATEKYMNRFDHIADPKRKTYAAMVSAVDDGVGLVLDQLEKLNLSENTLVVFLSDNGGPENRNASDNGPLRGQKGDLFEGGIRVPMAMRWPNKIQASSVYEEPVVSLDIFSMMIAQNFNKIQLRNPLDGVDILPYLTGIQTGPPHESLFWRRFDLEWSAIRHMGFKLIDSTAQAQLFNLESDLGESVNQVNHTKVLDLLREEKQKIASQMIEPAFPGLAFDNEYNITHPNRFKRPIKN